SEYVAGLERSTHLHVASLDILRRLDAEMSKSEHVARTQLARYSRKWKGTVSARNEFACEMVFNTFDLFGKRRYEEVAALTNVAFKGMADEITAETVRRALRKSLQWARRNTGIY